MHKLKAACAQGPAPDCTPAEEQLQLLQDPPSTTCSPSWGQDREEMQFWPLETGNKSPFLSPALQPWPKEEERLLY